MESFTNVLSSASAAQWTQMFHMRTPLSLRVIDTCKNLIKIYFSHFLISGNHLRPPPGVSWPLTPCSGTPLLLWAGKLMILYCVLFHYCSAKTDWWWTSQEKDFRAKANTHTLCAEQQHSLRQLTEVSWILLVLVIDHMPVGLVGFDALQRQKLKKGASHFKRKSRTHSTYKVRTQTFSGIQHNLGKVVREFDFPSRNILFSFSWKDFASDIDF